MSKLIATHLTVTAGAEDVWATLTDLARYRTWNPFITRASGTVALGERLDLTIQPPRGRAMAFRPWVTALEEHRYLEWLGRLAVPGIFDGRHSFKLTPMGVNRTLVQQSETVTGALVPFTGHLLARTHAGFVAMNEALARQTLRPTSGHSPLGE
ncbi:SRPBCC domain-containing protein [Pedococcus sp. KACC 23699]|uniref:SRPBCC domain-containing protein n=1 Tax=Pedococcus sp. KACC 23699 TaxID=3149228 RepID=A0AAU7JS51_9MICO